MNTQAKQKIWEVMITEEVNEDEWYKLAELTNLEEFKEEYEDLYNQITE